MPIFINDEPAENFIYSGGECHVNLLLHYALGLRDIPQWITVKADLFSSDDIMLLLLTIDAMRRIHKEQKIKLVIPYFPYARQDRVCNPYEPLSVKVMADLINSLRCEEVVIWDAHSDVTTALINNCVHYSQCDLLSTINTASFDYNVSVVSPDSGSEKKVRDLAKEWRKEIVYCSKDRDTSTGIITGTKVHDDVKDRHLIIVDDICDGGRTFIELAKVLKEKGCLSIELYVTHGIFAKGFEELNKYFDHIYCYHTVNNNYKSNDKFTILKKD